MLALFSCCSWEGTGYKLETIVSEQVLRHQQSQTLAPTTTKPTLRSVGQLFAMRLLGDYVAAAAILSPALAITISLGHDNTNKYAWISGYQPCPGTTISPTNSPYCGHTFDLGSSTYRVSNCGEDDFQLQERSGEEGWVFHSYCYPPDSGELRFKCGGRTKQWVVTEQFNCGVPSRRGSS